MMRVNMNQAATSSVKSKMAVNAAMAYLHSNDFESIGRGTGGLSTMEAILDARIAVSEVFGASPTEILFTSGASESLNLLINGLAAAFSDVAGSEIPEVLYSSMEHNSSSRPLHLLAKQGRIRIKEFHVDANSPLDLHALESLITPATKAIVTTHASNVFGNILPIEQIFGLAKSRGLLTILDASQTAGHIEVKLDDVTDAIAFTSHKGLRSISGSGGFAVKKSVVSRIAPWKTGGTGSFSQSLEMPEFLPDKFEVGTPNIIGILALGAACRELGVTGFEERRAKEMQLLQHLVSRLSSIEDVILYGAVDYQRWMPVLSINLRGKDPSVAAHRLEHSYGIATRTGLHCSPLAHKSMGTMPEGTIRLSFHAEHSMEELDYVCDSIAKVTKEG